VVGNNARCLLKLFEIDIAPFDFLVEGATNHAGSVSVVIEQEGQVMWPQSRVESKGVF
jgi:hypothetical protein